MTDYEYEKLMRNIRCVAVFYIVAILGIVFLPYLKTEYGVNILGFKAKEVWVIAGITLIAFISFVVRFIKNYDAQEKDIRLFHYEYPLMMLIVFGIMFLGGDHIAKTFEQDSVSRAFSGKVVGLNYMGPSVYCISVAIVCYCTNEIDKILKSKFKNIK